MPEPHVLLGDQARSRLKEGLDLLAELIRLTLGPHAGAVACHTEGKAPEFLTSSGVLARRIVEIPGRGASVGAMLLRHAVWQVHEQVGDGGATTAALVHALLGAGYRQVAAGANPMQLRRGMQRGVEAAVAALRAQARPIGGVEQLAGLASAATGDAELGGVLGEIFERLGPQATIDVEEYVAAYLAYAIEQGMVWEGSLASPAFIADVPAQQTLLVEPYILVTDQRIGDPAQIVPLLEQIMQEEGGPLLVLAEDVTGSARATLLANRERGVLDVVAATLDIDGGQRARNLEDIAILTRARFFAKDGGDRIEEATIDDLGYAGLVKAGVKSITIVGAAGEPDRIDERRRGLAAQLAAATDEDTRRRLRKRLGRLAGWRAVLKLGAATETERAARRDLAERAIQLMATALEEGVVAGGGTAYLQCQSILDELTAEDDEERQGILLVRDALEAPMAWLARNAGLCPGVVLAEVRRHGPDVGYDVLSDRPAQMWDAQILDAAKVARVALETAVSLAGTALTTEAIILRRQPAISITP